MHIEEILFFDNEIILFVTTSVQQCKLEIKIKYYLYI